MLPLELPVLAVEIDGVVRVEGEDALCGLLSLFHKCKEGLREGDRLENMAWRLWSVGRSPSHAIVSGITAGEHPFVSPSSPSSSSSSSSCFHSDVETEPEKLLIFEDDRTSTEIAREKEIWRVDDKARRHRHRRQHSHSSCRSGSRRSHSHSESTSALSSAAEAAADHPHQHRHSHRRKSSHKHSSAAAEPRDSTPTADSRHDGSMVAGSAPGMARRPSLASKRTHSNTSVGRIMVDLLPEKLDVPHYSTLCARRVPSVSALSDAGRSSSTALTTTTSSDGTSSQILMKEKSRREIPLVMEPERLPQVQVEQQPIAKANSANLSPQMQTQRFPTVVIVNPTPHPTPPMTPQVSPPGYMKDTRFLPTPSNTTGAKPGLGNFTTAPLLTAPQVAIASGSVDVLTTTPANTPLPIRSIGPSSTTQLPASLSTRFFIAHADNGDGDSPDSTSASSQGTRSVSIISDPVERKPNGTDLTKNGPISGATSAQTGEPASMKSARSVDSTGTGNGSGGRSASRTRRRIGVKGRMSHAAGYAVAGGTLQRSRVGGKAGAAAAAQAQAQAHSAQLAIQYGLQQEQLKVEAQQREQMRVLQEQQKQQQLLLQQQQNEKRERAEKERAAVAAANASAAAEKDRFERENGKGKEKTRERIQGERERVKKTNSDPGAAKAGKSPSSVQKASVQAPGHRRRPSLSSRSSRSGAGANVRPALRAGSSSGKKERTSSSGAAAAAPPAPTRQHHLELADDDSEYSTDEDDDWDTEDVTGSVDEEIDETEEVEAPAPTPTPAPAPPAAVMQRQRSSRGIAAPAPAPAPRTTHKAAGKGRARTSGPPAPTAADLERAAQEAAWQRSLFEKYDRKSYTELARARTQSGLLSKIFHPDPEIFPADHPYRYTRSTQDILAHLKPNAVVGAGADGGPTPGAQGAAPYNANVEQSRQRYPPGPSGLSRAAPTGLQPSRGTTAGPVAAAVTAAGTPTSSGLAGSDMSMGDARPSQGHARRESDANRRSPLRLRGRPEGVEVEEGSDTEDDANKLHMSASMAEQKLAALQRRMGQGRGQQQSQVQAQGAQVASRPPPHLRQLPTVPPPPSTLNSHAQAQAQASQYALPRSATAPVPIAALGFPYNLPPPEEPSTPRTTRRNMLTHELSESLRRNLLWERQVSKQRPMGLGRRAVSNATAAAMNANGSGNGQERVRSQQQQEMVNGNGSSNGTAGVNGNHADSNTSSDTSLDERRKKALARNKSWLDTYYVAGW